MGHAIIKRLLIYCDVDFVVEVEFPLRGGEILSQISSYNILSADIPVICLIDLNGGACPPQKIEKLLLKHLRMINLFFELLLMKLNHG